MLIRKDVDRALLHNRRPECIDPTGNVRLEVQSEIKHLLTVAESMCSADMSV